jgi:hypothetical protein
MALKALDLNEEFRFQPEPPDTPGATVFVLKAITAAKWTAAYAGLFAEGKTPEQRSYGFQKAIVQHALARVENYMGQEIMKGPFPDAHPIWESFHPTVWEMLVNEVSSKNTLSFDEKKTLPVRDNGLTSETTEGTPGTGIAEAPPVPPKLDEKNEDVTGLFLSQ